MKTVLLVPGFKEDIHSRDYKSTIKAIKDSGYNVKFIPIEWSRTTIDNWVNELWSEYSKYDPEEIILAGFSFGAVTAFIAAAKQNPSELWLFSLSPYFYEDIHSSHMRTSWLRSIGHRRVSAFEKHNFKELSKGIDCKTLIFAGQEEFNKWPGMMGRTLSADMLISKSELTIIDGVAHDVSDRRYIDAIRQAIQA